MSVFVINHNDETYTIVRNTNANSFYSIPAITKERLRKKLCTCPLVPINGKKSNGYYLRDCYMSDASFELLSIPNSDDTEKHKALIKLGFQYKI